MRFKKVKVRSEESQFDLFGFTVQEHEFFETIATPSVFNVRDAYFGLSFQMNLNEVAYDRNIYNVWDLFGDVGGLFDMLQTIGNIYYSLIG